jgi:putative peptidoglycan lipid II flippase
MVVALAFGASPITDAFFVAFRIPNILRRLLAEGALSTAIVPVFSEYSARTTWAEQVRMARAVLAASLVALVGTTVVGILAAPWIVTAIAPGFAEDAGQFALTVVLTRLMFPYLVLVGLAALAMGALNAHGRFFAAALGPAVLNAGMIGGVLALSRHVDPAIVSLAFGVLAGGVGQLLIQLPSLRGCGLLVAPSADFAHPALARVARLLLPSVFGLAAVQVMVFVNTLLGSLLPAGSISFLYYADRVMEFPLGIFGIALASASLPVMARQAAAGDHPAVTATLNFALRMAIFVSVPATVGLIVLRQPIVRVLFERGRFGPADTAATAEALAWYAAGLAGIAGARIAAQAFYAIAEPGIAVRVGLVAVGVNALAALALIHLLGHAGLAAATSIGAWVNLIALLWAARHRFGAIGGRALVRSAVRTGVAALALGGWCAAAQLVWPVRPSLVVEAGWLAAAIAGGVGVFWGASVVLGAPERTALLHRSRSTGVA